MTTSNWTTNTTQMTVMFTTAMDHRVWGHKHPRGRIHMFNASGTAFDRDIEISDLKGEPLCNSKRTVQFVRMCGKVGDEEHPLSTVCRHCDQIRHHEEQPA